MLMMIGNINVRKKASEYERALCMTARVCRPELFDLPEPPLLKLSRTDSNFLLVAAINRLMVWQGFEKQEPQKLPHDMSAVPFSSQSSSAFWAVMTWSILSLSFFFLFFFLSSKAPTPNFLSFFSCTNTSRYIINMVVTITPGNRKYGITENTKNNVFAVLSPLLHSSAVSHAGLSPMKQNVPCIWKALKDKTIICPLEERK